MPGSIEAAVEALIALLDAIDGDADDEPEEDECLAGDDGCGFVVRQGEIHWGSGWDEPYEPRFQPEYGVDQTATLGAWYGAGDWATRG